MLFPALECLAQAWAQSGHSEHGIESGQYGEAFGESDWLLEGSSCQLLVCDLGQQLNISITL